MVQKIESYETHPESIFPVPDMTDGVEVDLDFLLNRIINTRNLKWIEAHGTGQFDGLPEHITDRFVQTAPKCDPTSCSMYLEVQAYRPSTGDSEHVKLALQCPHVRTDTEEEAQEIENRCLANHQATLIAFEGFVTSSVAKVTAAEAVINDANEQIVEARRKLDEIL
jgi:hypothetical protein